MSASAASTSAALALVAQDMTAMDAVIEQRLASDVPLVGQISRYIVAAGGKRLRPALLLLMCGALNCRSEQRLNLAAVVEFIHTATLLHDDVVDESTLRRGRPTANEAFGNPASVLVGSLSETQYLNVIRSKTAKLFEASARLAAILAGSSPGIEAACAEYGQALGTAFQVIDDVLDYDGDVTQMGKNLGDDLREGKVTLPLIVAMERGSPADHQMIRLAIEEGGVEQLDAIVAIVHSTGAIETTRLRAAQEAQRAIDAASSLPDNVYRQALIDLAAQLLVRRS
ncbi:MAG: polyprenyl synthetase family protein [Comamonadaceae bacterium]|nr:polyprenyl synthetase family protein [Comamonadaceae bacterium]